MKAGLFLKKPERPPAMPFGRRTAGHRDDDRFRPAVKNPARVIGIFASFQGKHPLQSALHIGGYRVGDGGDTNPVRFSGLFMGECFPVAFVKGQQYLAPRPYRSGCVFLPQRAFDRFDIVFRKLDMVLLGSGHVPSSRFLYAITKQEEKKILPNINMSIL
jgi:hypothetical protein